MSDQRFHESWVVLSSTVGSKAYGLDHADSDTDYKSVAVPPLSDFLGFNESWTGTSWKMPEVNAEHTVYEIRRFMAQCCNASPESLDILFSPYVTPRSPFGFSLLAIRDQFLSVKVMHSYPGFAHSQLKKIRNNPSTPQAAKQAVHVRRLMVMAYEILNTGKVNVDRSRIDADFLKDYKAKWTPDALVDLESYVAKMEARFAANVKESSLPHSPPRKDLNEWLVNRLTDHFKDSMK